MIAINAAPTERNATILSEIENLEYFRRVGQETLSGTRPPARRADGTECEREAYERWIRKAELFVPILTAALEPASPPEPPPTDQLAARVAELEEHLQHVNWLLLAGLAEADAERAWHQEAESPDAIGPRYQAWCQARAARRSHEQSYQCAHPR